MASVTRLKRRLGGFLVALRQRAKQSAEGAAVELKIARPTLTRYESGEVLPPWSTVRLLLAFYGATDVDLAQATRLFEDARDEPQSVRLPAGAPKAYRTLVNAEREAVRERRLAPCVIPGLLQTEKYARALIEAGRALQNPDTQPDSVVATRMNRQKPLDGPDPMVLHALIDEAAIRRTIGGPAVLREQLDHLLDAAERPNITLQVIPFAAGGYGTMAGSCIIVDFPEPDPSAVYIEYPAGGAWVDNREDVTRFITMFDEVTRLALTPADTTTLIHDQQRAPDST